MDLSLSWSEYELISLKTKPTSYWEQSSFRQTGSPRTIVNKLKSCLPPEQEQTKGLSGRGFPLYAIVSTNHNNLFLSCVPNPRPVYLSREKQTARSQGDDSYRIHNQPYHIYSCLHNRNIFILWLKYKRGLKSTFSLVPQCPRRGCLTEPVTVKSKADWQPSRPSSRPTFLDVQLLPAKWSVFCPERAKQFSSLVRRNQPVFAIIMI